MRMFFIILDLSMNDHIMYLLSVDTAFCIVIKNNNNNIENEKAQKRKNKKSQIKIENQKKEKTRKQYKIRSGEWN